jgi:16S rRNA (uracil1498-N3)-methyltransferase
MVCEIIARDRDAMQLRVREARSVPAPPFSVTLLQAIPKGKIIEDIIQKATELGVARVVPILSERVVTQLDAGSAEAKAAKWQTVAIEAIKQSGNLWLPAVETPVSLETFLARGESFDLALVACLEAGSRHPRSWFDSFAATYGSKPRMICLWIGPEGDFTAAEYRRIQESGARPVTLGPLVLRVETAATYSLSVVNYELSFAPEAG